jgi:hypothetical protein
MIEKEIAPALLKYILLDHKNTQDNPGITIAGETRPTNAGITRKCRPCSDLSKARQMEARAAYRYTRYTKRKLLFNERQEIDLAIRLHNNLFTDQLTIESFCPPAGSDGCLRSDKRTFQLIDSNGRGSDIPIQNL